MSASQLRALSLFEDYVLLLPHEREQALARLREEEPDVHLTLVAMLAADAGTHPLDHASPNDLLGHIDPTPIPPQYPHVGRRIGPWRIARAIGAGGMGTVYEAHRDDGQYQQRVALKCIRQELTSPALVDAFLNERNTLARLDHAGIVPLLDGGVDEDGFPWFAMRYVEGETIDQWCDHRRRTVRQRVELVRQACDALAYAHQRRVLHQDIKPSNLLVTVEGQVQIVDFGLSATLAGDRPLRRIAVSHGYAAPEALSPARPTTALDVYSLGAVLYLLLCGRLPGAPRGYRPLAANAEPEPPSRLARDVPREVAQARGVADGRALSRQLKGDLDAILLRCCAVDPARRYSTAAELGQDLARWLHTQPVDARQGGIAYRAATFVRRHRLACGLAALVVVTLGTGAVAAYLQSQRAAREAESSAALSAVFEQTLGNATLSGLGQDTFSSGDLLASTETQIRRLDLRESPRLMARGLLALARNHAVIGDYRKATALADEAARLPGADADTALEVQATRASLQNLAGRPGDALRTAQSALAPLQGASGAAPSFVHLQLLAEVAQAQWNLARREDALGTLDRALAMAAAHRDAHPDEYASLLTLRGKWKVRLQDFPPADEDLRQAIAASRPTRPLMAAEAERALTESLFRQERFKEAVPLAESQWESAVRRLGPTHPKTGSALIALGNARCLDGDLAGCRAAIEEGEALLSAAFGEDHPAHGEALMSRAMLERFEGTSWDRLIATSRRALTVLEHAYPPGHDTVVNARSQLANRLTLFPRTLPMAEQKQYKREARDLFERVVSESLQQHLPPPPLARTNLARRLKDDDGDLARAEILLKQNAAFLDRHYPSAHSYHDTNRIVLADLLVSSKRLDEADQVCALIEKSAQLQLPNPNAHIRLNGALMIRAAVAVEQGDRQRALRILEQAHALVSQAYPADHRLVVTTARAIDDLKTKGRFF